MADWLPEHDQFLRECLTSGLSTARAADALNAKFGTDYSRASCVGRAWRKSMDRNRAMGPIVRKERKDKGVRKVEPRPAPVRRTKFQPPPEDAAEPFSLRCVEIEPLHVSLFDLNDERCRWPYGDGPFTFCGHPAVFGSYCGPHYGLSVGAGTGSERAAHRVSRKVA